MGATVASHQLLPGVRAEILADGTLVFRAEATGEALLTARVPALSGANRSRERGKSSRVIQACLTEGIAGGRRGFSANSDDDGDGQVDEDRKDGLDNDRDGLIDEDFAAISDDMTVVHRQEGIAWVHQESYHWSYPLLRPAVFLSLASEAAGLVALEVSTSAGRWQEMDVSPLLHSVPGRSEASTSYTFVTLVEDPVSGPLWVAVMLLGDHAGYLALGSDRANELEFPLSATPLPLVVCAARSWLQLTGMLAESDLVYWGVTDPLSERTAGWIVPPSSSLWHTPELPAITLHRESDQELLLKMHVKPGQSSLADPDLFRLNGQSLGFPEKITWRPSLGVVQTMAWEEVTLSRLQGQINPPMVSYSRMKNLADCRAEGTLEFQFPGTGQLTRNSGGTLSGTWLDGRSFRADVQAPGKPESVAPPGLGALVESQPGITTELTEGSDQAGALLDQGADWRPPSLAPELLEGWPNPFRDVILIKFKVPETVGEAFVWVDEKDRPKNLDLQSAVPWKGGTPTASVRIYNINGQELVTLHDGSAVGGEYTVNWNGTDIFGRQVASGTYFCKLQLDQWSVTRRIVYLR